MEILGKIEKIGGIQEISASFKKRDLVIRTEEQYPQPILIEFTQDRTDLLNNVNVGDRVGVSINIRGREWTSPKGEVKYFVSLHGWRIQASQNENAPGAGQEPPVFDAPTPSAETFNAETPDDDLPF